MIILDKRNVTQMKQKKQSDPEFEINSWNPIHYWCNCNRGTCTVTPCSHIMMLMYLIFCIKNDITTSES